MTKHILLACFLLLCPLFVANGRQKTKEPVIRIETTAGTIRVRLFDDTPLHRDNFLRLAREGFYEGLLFHRVIKDFMIQAGDPDSRDAKPGEQLGEGNNGYFIPPEFDLPYLYHWRGALAAAREGDDVNPDQYSSGCQFYIVWGKKWLPAPMDKILVQLAEKGIGLTKSMIDDYEVRGGCPHLDGQYTVFGEVIEGLKIVKNITLVETDQYDRPIEDVKILKTAVE